MRKDSKVMTALKAARQCVESALAADKAGDGSASGVAISNAIYCLRSIGPCAGVKKFYSAEAANAYGKFMFEHGDCDLWDAMWDGDCYVLRYKVGGKWSDLHM